MRNNPLAKKLGSSMSQENRVDFLRLSHNVRKNMKKDEENETQN